MRHTCEHCDAQYEIDDKKIAGRFLKVRCRRCHCAMHVVGPREERGFWAAIGQVPRGPYRDEEVLALCGSGDIHARTRMWTAGMSGWERVCESLQLAWVYDEILAQTADADDPRNAFTRAALLTDGHGYFPDPTLKSGIILLDDEAQRALERLAAKAERKRKKAAGTHAWPTMLGPIAAAIVGAFAGAAGVAWFIAQSV
jgi:predicted Zn finger-like uncharacterized protein